MNKGLKTNNGDESTGDIPLAKLLMRLVGQPAPASAEPDVPPLSAEAQEALASFQRRQQVLRDLTLGCRMAWARSLPPPARFRET